MFSGEEAMKGQFFIVGALFICILLFFSVSPATMLTGYSADLEFCADNAAREMPHALNMGINSSKPVQTLENFTLFMQENLAGRLITLKTAWFVFYQSGSSVNVTAGNFLGYNSSFMLNISGTEKTLYVTSNQLNSTVFPVTGKTYDVSLDSVDIEMGAQLMTNKTSFYSLVILEKGSDMVRKEILA